MTVLVGKQKINFCGFATPVKKLRVMSALVASYHLVTTLFGIFMLSMGLVHVDEITDQMNFNPDYVFDEIDNTNELGRNDEPILWTRYDVLVILGILLFCFGAHLITSSCLAYGIIKKKSAFIVPWLTTYLMGIIFTILMGITFQFYLSFNFYYFFDDAKLFSISTALVLFELLVWYTVYVYYKAAKMSQANLKYQATGGFIHSLSVTNENELPEKKVPA